MALLAGSLTANHKDISKVLRACVREPIWAIPALRTRTRSLLPRPRRVTLTQYRMGAPNLKRVWNRRGSHLESLALFLDRTLARVRPPWENERMG